MSALFLAQEPNTVALASINKPILIMIVIEHFYLQVLKAVDELNKDSTIHGIIVQLPPDSVEPIDPAICTNAVAPEKDVDG